MSKVKKTKKLPTVMYIYCEGEKTEPFYLDGYISTINKSKLNVFKIPKTRKNTPEQLVDEAISKKNSSSSADGDQFWVVYDREAVNSASSQAHERAWQKAKKNGINVAISCVCFEFWILLHFGFTTAPFVSYSSLMSASPIKKLLNDSGISNYQKGDKKTFYYLSNRVSTARSNAAKLEAHLNNNNADTKNPYRLDSYTGMHNLLDAIDAF